MFVVRKYQCLDIESLDEGKYSIVPIRDGDKYLIMQWRNEQLDILRQPVPITKEMQELYFSKVISPLFDEEKPVQLLFSFLENGKLAGYGGLVHIDWNNRNAEISFLLPTEKTNDPVAFSEAWTAYLRLISSVAFQHLHLHKIYTYAYSIRENLFPILEKNGFSREAQLKEHVRINGAFNDVLIHTLFNK